MNLFRYALGALPLAVALASLPAHADEESAQAQIDRLEQKVRALESRLEALEGRYERGVPVNKALEVEAKPGGWRNADNWAQLAKDMTEEEVIRFLGEPENRKSVKKFEYWLYGDGKAAMYMNRLKSWKTPSQAAMR